MATAALGGLVSPAPRGWLEYAGASGDYTGGTFKQAAKAQVGDPSVDVGRARVIPSPVTPHARVAVYTRYVVRATFMEPMELRQFPMDVQRLHIRAALWHCPEAVGSTPLSATAGSVDGAPSAPTTKPAEGPWAGEPGPSAALGARGAASLVASPQGGRGGRGEPPREEGPGGGIGEASGAAAVASAAPGRCRTVKLERGSSLIYKEAFVLRDAWELYDHVVLKQGLTRAERNDDYVRFTTLTEYVCVRRKLGFYWWNICMPIFLLVFIAFASFVLDTSALPDRLNLTVVVLLTLVAFKLVVAQSLPATSYLTLMDVYTVTAFLFVFLVALQNLVAYVLYKADDGTSLAGTRDRADVFNLWSGAALVVAWGVLHGVVLPGAVASLRGWQRLHAQRDDGDEEADKVLEESPLVAGVEAL
ncbi:hypothetical protein HYH03_006399 [Edaphochlamys debaryana]|uniref:Neurotransmitter-gated ion-channel transmembrane domain-containing protein n=1 Tax=Edaphochlamys debaryana TaxID=47281 RepID=A0A835Y3W0_9CHLO|nr:hypothetical protein HYH03_006399 [Edaphochlamys debaryana]|eukprot:KAG2495453.1 hypothetical protein HYH03_006399 [Edaphochlamys debaryana]